MMKKWILRTVFLIPIGIIASGVLFSEPGATDEEKIIGYIKADQPELLAKYFSDKVSLSLNGDGYLGIFNRAEAYSGFSQKKGYLYAMIYDTKEIRRLSGIPNIESFKDAFNKGKTRVGRRSIQVTGEKLIFGIAYKKDQQGRISISAFDLEDVR